MVAALSLVFLLTGGAGFTGSNFVRWAHERHPDWRITTLDKLTYAGRLENLRDVIDSPRHRFVKGDIADAGVARPLVRESDLVVHFAAETHVDRSLMAAGEFIHTDIFGTFVLLEAARRHGAQLVRHAGGKAREGGVASVSVLPSGSRT